MKQLSYSILGVTIAEILFWVVLGGGALALGEFAPYLEWNKGEWWWMLAALPVSALAFIINLKWKVKAVEKLAEAHLADGIVKGFSAGRQTWRFLFWRLSVAFAMLGLLGPKVGSKLVEVESKGSDIVIAIDIKPCH